MNWTFVRQVGVVPWAVRFPVLQFRKRVLKHDTHMKLPSGLKMLLPIQSASATEVYMTGANIDWGAEEIFAQYADKNHDFLDIGSHIGYYSMYLSPLVRKVYAFEPNPLNLPSLRTNAVSAKNVEVFDAAISSQDGVAVFYLSENSATGSLIQAEGASKEVTVYSVDKFMASHPEINVGLIKTDIEGRDLNAMLGARETIKRFQPLVVTECSFDSELKNFCSQVDYSIFGIVRNRKTQKTQMMKEDAADFHTEWLKMLFLVPPRLVASFEKRCGLPIRG